MSLTASATLPPLDGRAAAELRAAFEALENPSLAARLSATVGTPIEALTARLPSPLQGGLQGAVRTALTTAMGAALRSSPAAKPPGISSSWLHRGLAAATGAAGGAFGLAGTLVELPVSTTVLLRQIAAVAAEEGEDLARPEIAAECLKIFALGGRGSGDDAAESGYFALRIALAEALKGSIGASVLPGFIAAIASRFVGPVGLKLSAQAAPLIGAAAGAAINLAFLEHFRTVARGHFTLRRLERVHGAAAVRLGYERLAATRDVAFARG
ncbi:MAG: EcsC family protein [Roseomonas sp.]